MKIRQGFVSNSSSSSFVIGVGKPFDTALDVAEHMVPFREFDTDQELLNKIRKLKEGRAKELTAVCFGSCNYDTFIAIFGDVFLIETCHNHQWDLHKWTVPCPAEYYDYFGDDSFYNLSRSIDFLHLEFDHIGRVVDWMDRKGLDYCECGSYRDFWWVGEKIICVACGKTPKKKKETKS